ncbi:unnamed protein product [Leptidea sinapis]|uniref:Kazal-like domain-containing protein n=1 Tax=Leptidea sinapis TaxID=189913 RepID=A0A5E4QCU1_9NEOP|nr:unnamed protein product [Leptidea sinapis]
MDPKERMNSTLLLVGVLLLSFVSYSEQESIESLDDVLVYPMEPASSRRSFSGPPVFVPRNANEPSPWCAVSVVCQRSLNPICGYDEIFGYGKFDDICHMLKVNCFWKFNFALVPSCRPGT